MYLNKEMDEEKGSKKISNSFGIGKIYLVCGYINSGKDTFSDYLVSKGGWVKLSFADPLKEMASLRYGIPISHYYSRELKEKSYTKLTTNPKGLGILAQGQEANRLTLGASNISPRQTCLDIGKEKRKIDPDYWVNLTCDKINVNSNYIISDCRFPNEVNGLKRRFPNKEISVIWIDRYNKSSISDVSENSISKDSDFIDIVIDNKTTLKDFKMSIDLLV